MASRASVSFHSAKNPETSFNLENNPHRSSMRFSHGKKQVTVSYFSEIWEKTSVFEINRVSFMKFSQILII